MRFVSFSLSFSLSPFCSRAPRLYYFSYVILLLPQPAAFSPPANLSQPNVGVSVFVLTDYISVRDFLGLSSSLGVYSHKRPVSLD